jgi:O-antigen ligase
MATQNKTAQKKGGARPMIFAAAAGLFLFLAFVKFGDPVVLDGVFPAPSDLVAIATQSWPLAWGCWLLVALAVVGVLTIRWTAVRFKSPVLLPAAWLLWQFISATQTINPPLTSLTFEHFTVCVALFYLGYFGLKGVRDPWPVWTGLALALCWVMRGGFEQHFGGLEATRRLFYSTKDQLKIPPELLNDPAYLRRVTSTRIFSTFANPDSFAGGIELLLPISLLFLWHITPKVRTPIRSLFVIILGGAGLACLFWTGSKAGWLVALVMAMIALGWSGLSVKWRNILIGGVLILGVVGFVARYASTVKKQEVSVGTRLTYWKAAVRIAADNPILGTGPGTFFVSYSRIKGPDDDFAHLTHNDYLEQACDSGFLGCFLYTAAIIGYLWSLYRYRIAKKVMIDGSFVVWLGILGICLHSLVDYHLYIPALAWPMFFLLGWILNYNED